MNLIIGSHVSFNSKKQLLGSVEEALSYNANTFMIYTGGAQSTIRSNINDEYTYEAFKLMIENNINPKNIIVHAPYIVNLANKSDEELMDFICEALQKRHPFYSKAKHLFKADELEDKRQIQASVDSLRKKLNK